MITYIPQGVCAREIQIELDGDTVKSVRIIGGCSGNTQGVGALIAGMKIEEAIRRLKGIRCKERPTSCPDQLARALEETLEHKEDKENE